LQYLKNLSLRANIALFTGLSLLAALVVGGLGGLQMWRSEAAAQEVLGSVRQARAVGMLDMMHDALRGDALRVLFAARQDEGARAEVAKDLDEHATAMARWLATLEGEVHDEALRASLAATRPAVEAYIAAARELPRLAADEAVATAALDAVEQRFASLETRLEEVGERVEAVAAQTAQQQADLFASAGWSMAAALALAAAVLAGFGLQFLRTTHNRLGAEPRLLHRLSQRIADGDLCAADDLAGAPADSVADAMLRMRQRLAEMVVSIHRSAEQLASASAQIASGNADLAQRTSEQSARLQHSASAMQQLGSAVHGNADSARQADELARAASRVAVQGGEVVNQVVHTMSGINESSRRIADIIGVIDGIAFQTNILALNAAVEAARAGEQGRGFAVVAGEVRQLAQRSAEAAREIKSLIGASVERADEGTAFVDRAGDTMQEIVASIGRLTGLMGEISAASAQQSASVSEVGESVRQMDGAVQQNAALVEQTAAAAESLREHARSLVATVGVFRIQGQTAAA